ncbi:MAG: hypothetical protein MRY83_06020 [Flavobacteriales bacterium]|nr:hypothetical protein [Flavobacteriales bacterium]
MLKYSLLLIAAYSLVLKCDAQIRGYAKKEAFPNTLEHESKGWYFDPGITLQITRPGERTEEINGLNYSFDSKGKIGPYFGVGRYKILKNWMFFKYWDYGLSYKWFRGEEHLTIEGAKQPTSAFSDMAGGLTTNLVNVINLGKYSFLQNGFGINVDYQFRQSRTPLAGPNDPDRITAQLHYKLGVGLWVGQRLIVVPSVEFPILGATPKLIDPTFTYFDSWYEPLLISLRIMLVSPKKDVCPPVYAPGLPENFTPDGMD